MVLSQKNINVEKQNNSIKLTTSQKRRIRRKRLNAAIISKSSLSTVNSNINTSIVFNNKSLDLHTAYLDKTVPADIVNEAISIEKLTTSIPINYIKHSNSQLEVTMSSKDGTEMSREEVKAAREAKKLAKQKAKNKKTDLKDQSIPPEDNNKNKSTKEDLQNVKATTNKTAQNDAKKISDPKQNVEQIKAKKDSQSKDEVDKAVPKTTTTDQIKTNIAVAKLEAEVKKLDKKQKADKNLDVPVTDITVKDVVNTLKDIVNIAKEVQTVTARVEAIDLGSKKAKPIPEESGKSKAELKAERRAKQEAQRAAKQAAAEKLKQVKKEPSTEESENVKEDKVVKSKIVEKPKAKSQIGQKMNWFGANPLVEHNREESLRKIALNSNMHPAIVKLGVQLATHVVTGANAKCIALLDALKKVVRDYSLPARTEFGRGLDAHVSRCADFLWQLRPPGAAQLNALSHLRRHLTHLPADVHEFDAKKRLQEEIDRYIREQIDMAGEAISIAVRNKISDGDRILTYGCSSLIERILCEAHAAGTQFHAIVAGSRSAPAARELLRRLLARGLPCGYVDITSLSSNMMHVSKVLLGCESLLANGAVLSAAGALGVALAARAHNVPLLVACETHKFSDRVHTDAFLCDEIGDPDDLIDKTDDNSPLKDWRSNPNLNLFNLMYDVTPPSLVTAVVTELAILPCTSAPVVLRYKLAEYGI